MLVVMVMVLSLARISFVEVWRLFLSFLSFHCLIFLCCFLSIAAAVIGSVSELS